MGERMNERTPLLPSKSDFVVVAAVAAVAAAVVAAAVVAAVIKLDRRR